MFANLCSIRPGFPNAVIVFWWLLFLFYFCVPGYCPRACPFLAFSTASGWPLATAALRRPLHGGVHFPSTPYPLRGFPVMFWDLPFFCLFVFRVHCQRRGYLLHFLRPSYHHVFPLLFSYFLNVLLNYVGHNHSFFGAIFFSLLTC